MNDKELKEKLKEKFIKIFPNNYQSFSLYEKEDGLEVDITLNKMNITFNHLQQVSMLLNTTIINVYGYDDGCGCETCGYGGEIEGEVTCNQVNKKELIKRLENE